MKLRPQGFKRMWKLTAILLLVSFCVHAEEEQTNKGNFLKVDTKLHSNKIEIKCHRHRLQIIVPLFLFVKAIFANDFATRG